MDKQLLIAKVDAALEILRPYLHADGGDLQVVDITESYVLQLKPSGSCRDCPHIDQTVQYGISDTLKREVPEIKDIEILY